MKHKTQAEVREEFLAELQHKVMNQSADVTRGNTPCIVLPPDMELKTAGDILHRIAEQEEEVVEHSQEFEDWAYHDLLFAFTNVWESVFGPVKAGGKEVQTPFGTFKLNPRSMRIQISHSEQTTVHYGQFNLPRGYVSVGMRRDGTPHISAEVPRKFLPLVETLCERTEHFLKTNSLYKGKAWDFTNPQEEFKFRDHSAITLDLLIFPEKMRTILEDEIFAFVRKPNPVQYPAGVLLHGTYGTGKTLIGAALANECVKYGKTFVWLRNPLFLSSALRTIRQYGGGVLFMEDGDRVLSGERAMEHDILSQEMDGLHKRKDVMLIITSNNAETIHPLFLRPERMDAFIHLGDCDEEHATLLVQHYSNSNGPESIECGKLLVGQTPATIANVIRKAMQRGNGTLDLKRVHGIYEQMRFHLELLKRKSDEHAAKNGKTLEDLLRNFIKSAAYSAVEEYHE